MTNTPTTLATRVRAFLLRLAGRGPRRLTAEDRAHAVLDQIGAPAEQEGRALSVDRRLLYVVTTFGNHEAQMRGQIAMLSNMNAALGKNMQAARAYLVGAPHASDLRIRRAIAALETGSPPVPPA